mmetsp:Transcript_86420/g.249634  ORF Transcript_86420/g.249634 Transcript_86420/m.249634 type:complete len:580 (-) Transcript_86420:59-1798(-)
MTEHSETTTNILVEEDAFPSADTANEPAEEPTAEETPKPAPAPAPKKPFSWGKPAPAAIPTNKKSFADIMAEESETKMVAQTAYQDSRSLAEIEAEQERLLRSFQGKESYHAQAVAGQLKSPPPAKDMQEVEDVGKLVAVTDDRKAPPFSETASSKKAPPSGEPDFLAEARNYLSEDEIREIERALQEADLNNQSSAAPPAAASIPAEASADGGLTEDEAAAIAAALREADAREEEESIRLAMQIQQQELSRMQKDAARKPQQGNVRSMTRAELESEARRLSDPYSSDSVGPPELLRGSADAAGVQMDYHRTPQHLLDDDDEMDEAAGFRMNSASAQEWARRDRNTIIGPNNEIRTKHDIHVQGQANAHFLGLEEDDFGLRTHVGNRAFNSFKKSMKRTTKGVATHGTGRAGTDSDAVKGKAMDPHVRLQISKAINSGLIEHCNGAVKQGKEAVVYHAEAGAESQGHDVAVKVFKRITEFRGRGAYVDGDPRYLGQSFRNSSEREQLEIWTEKEFRNLVRANRSKVPVPTPLHYKENIIFMRFMGTDGWPAPQIREVRMRKGSKKWEILYTQVLEAIRR